MKTETREIYKCEFCNKLYQRRKPALVHEQGCGKNPVNWRKCMQGCMHIGKKTTDYHEDTGYGSVVSTVNLLHCKAKDVFLYPPKVEAAKKWFDLGDEPNEPMPMECELYSNFNNYTQ